MSEQQPKLHVDGRIILNIQICTVQQDAAIQHYFFKTFQFFVCGLFNGPPLWSSGQSSWLQIQRSGFDFRCYQIFREVVGLERCPPSLVN
jgi:hypothetical protein